MNFIILVFRTFIDLFNLTNSSISIKCNNNGLGSDELHVTHSSSLNERTTLCRQTINMSAVHNCLQSPILKAFASHSLKPLYFPTSWSAHTLHISLADCADRNAYTWLTILLVYKPQCSDIYFRFRLYPCGSRMDVYKYNKAFVDKLKDMWAIFLLNNMWFILCNF